MGALVTKINCKDVFDGMYLLYNQLHLPCCVSVVVGDPCQTFIGPFGWDSCKTDFGQRSTFSNRPLHV